MEEIKEVRLADPIVATSEASALDIAVDQLEQRIRAIEVALGDLRAIRAEGAVTGRKTVAVGAMVAKGDVPVGGSVDEALHSLSLEQRISVKSGLIRAGLL